MSDTISTVQIWEKFVRCYGGGGTARELESQLLFLPSQLVQRASSALERPPFTEGPEHAAHAE